MSAIAGVDISEASVADAEEISALAMRTYADAFGADLKPGDLAYYLNRTLTASRWTEYFARDRVLLARIEGKAVGYVQFGPAKRPPGMEVRRLYVEAAQQGRGIGTELLERALAMPELAQATVVYIDTWEENAGARRLYERFGFRYEGEREPFVLRSGAIDGYDLVLVRRRPRP